MVVEERDALLSPNVAPRFLLPSFVEGSLLHQPLPKTLSPFVRGSAKLVQARIGNSSVAAAVAAGDSNYADANAANVVDDPLGKILPLGGVLEISDDNLSLSPPQVAACAGLESASMPLLPTGASSALPPELESSVARLPLQVLVSSIESGVVPPGSFVEGFLGSLLSILAPICRAPPGPL